MELVKHCAECRNFTEHDVCEICQQASRQERQLCIVESPADVLAIEATASYRGRYFVLMGHLSPLDGIGPEQLGLDVLAERIRANSYDEIILATNPTIEGEATAHYIFDLCAGSQVDVTRIAHGVPLGGELEFVDGSTLAHSFTGRRKFSA
jgi:recombination protein RecR